MQGHTADLPVLKHYGIYCIKSVRSKREKAVFGDFKRIFRLSVDTTLLLYPYALESFRSIKGKEASF